MNGRLTRSKHIIYLGYQMKVLLYNPPNEPIKLAEGLWTVREYKHSGFNIPGINVISMARIAGDLREKVSGIQLTVQDARIQGQSPEAFYTMVASNHFDVVITLAGCFTIKHDLQYIPPQKNILKIVCPLPASIPVDELVEQYRPAADVLTTTEVNQPLVEALIEYAANGEITRTAGLMVRKRNVWSNTGPANLTDWSKAAPAAFELFPFKTYLDIQTKNKNIKFLYLTQFGCPYGCSYCSQAKQRLQMIDAKTVVEELQYFVDTIGFKNISFIDNEFPIVKKRSIQICKGIIKRGLQFSWTCSNRVELANDQLYALMSQSGCKSILYGLETGDPDLKKNINKTHDEKIVKSAIDLTRKHKMIPSSFLMFGIPGETKDSVRTTLAFLKRVGVEHFSTSILFPTPGSPLYRELKSRGKLKETDWSVYKYQTELLFEHDQYTSIKDVKRNQLWLTKRMFVHVAYRKMKAKKTVMTIAAFCAYFLYWISPSDLLFTIWKRLPVSMKSVFKRILVT